MPYPWAQLATPPMPVQRSEEEQEERVPLLGYLHPRTGLE